MSKHYNPIEHFQQWFYEIKNLDTGDEINAMQLSTIGIDGFPKTRIVLLKRFTWEGFIFFTNYKSEKGKALANNNRASLLFNWNKSQREVHIYGHTEKIPENLSEGYFESRPRGSKLAAWVSEQSTIIPSRTILDRGMEQLEQKFQNKEIPKPPYWGGYILKPIHMEFIKYDAFTKANKVIQYTLQQDYNWCKTSSYRFL
ncbi:pyridoxamine 5'-phosphate oxidase [uncultured Aquimarina sp.]|uniref:pyridoxamine 5'-phosphate oxidase n=1 Tax=uncultured Aquimarina sp. TaxID=575652 RepID=UPI0026181726|nr:pyridoxamine 5'-phosphate oxidase [uncultured Aquimarina sp.]